MKKKIIISIVLLVSIVAGLIFLVLPRVKYINISSLSNIWTIYEDDLNNIKTNMDSITDPNESFEWWILKDTLDSDNLTIKTYNSLVGDIRTCYLETKAEEANYKYSNILKQYRNTKYISNNELDNINFYMKNEQCLNNFSTYNNIILSDDEENTSRILNEINKINDLNNTELFKKEELSYDDLLSKEIIKIHAISNLTDWLVIEYNSVK